MTTHKAPTCQMKYIICVSVPVPGGEICIKRSQTSITKKVYINTSIRCDRGLILCRNLNSLCFVGFDALVSFLLSSLNFTLSELETCIHSCNSKRIEN